MHARTAESGDPTAPPSPSRVSYAAVVGGARENRDVVATLTPPNTEVGVDGEGPADTSEDVFVEGANSANASGDGDDVTDNVQV